MPSAEVSRVLAADRGAVGRLLLEAVEDQWFERKSTRTEARKLAEAMVGFANADRGVIVVGLHGGVVEGTRHLLRHRNWSSTPGTGGTPTAPASSVHAV